MPDRRHICAWLACGMISWLACGMSVAGGAVVLAQSAPPRDWSRTPEQWASLCREIVAKLIRYPKRPRAGDVAPKADSQALVTVDRDGNVLDVRVLRSSGVPELDRAVVEAVWKAGRLPEPSLISAAAHPVVLIPIAFPER